MRCQAHAPRLTTVPAMSASTQYCPNAVPSANCFGVRRERSSTAGWSARWRRLTFSSAPTFELAGTPASMGSPWSLPGMPRRRSRQAAAEACGAARLMAARGEGGEEAAAEIDEEF